MMQTKICLTSYVFQYFKNTRQWLRQAFLLLSVLFLNQVYAADYAIDVAVSVSDYKIGVYYFPGWKSGQKGAPSQNPWEAIKPYPELEPLLGYYAEDGPLVMKTQLKWMHGYGIDYVVFDWLWGPDGKPYLSHAVNSYLTTPDRSGVDFSILWANHTQYIFSKTQFEEIFAFWVHRYFFRPDYLKIDGKPVVFIFSAEVMNKNAEKIGMTSAELIELAQNIARNAGLPGINFIGGVGGNNGRGFDYSVESGYAGFSAYNFHGPATFRYDQFRTLSHSYKELDIGYRDQWKWFVKNASGLYILPMTSGWDKRPWGGSADPLHDNSLSTPAQFESHLRAGRQFITENAENKGVLGVICCWNEFGEGSFIEPTKSHRFQYLEKVRAVFGPNSK